VLERAWLLRPDDFWVNYASGRVHWRRSLLDPPQEAIRFFSAAVAIRPMSAAAHHSLGFALIGQGKVDEGIAQFRQAIRLKPDDVTAHLFLGDALRGQGDFSAAIAELRQARESAKTYPGAGSASSPILRRVGPYRDRAPGRPDHEAPCRAPG
jgi:tetratricopeptide (TPR) repeat protein